MTNRKIEALKEMAERGGSENERLLAVEALARMGIKFEEKPKAKHSVDQWSSMGVVTHTKAGKNTYVRGASLIHLLKYVQEKRMFTYKSAPFCPEYNQGDFYAILSWMMKCGLVQKYGSRYAIPSMAKVKEMWNKEVDKMKI
jgi:hypothetical protein